MPSRRKFLTQVSLFAGSVLGSSLGNGIFAILRKQAPRSNQYMYCPKYKSSETFNHPNQIQL